MSTEPAHLRPRARISKEDLKEACRIVLDGQEMFLGTLAWSAHHLVPNEPQDIVDWCRDKLRLPFAVSPERQGPLVFNPIQAAIIRETQSAYNSQVTFKKPPRFGSSLMSVAIILYNAFHEGRSIIYYERSEDASQGLHDKFLIPIIENSSELLALMRPRTKAGVQDAWSDIILLNGAVIQLRSASNNGHFRAIKGNPVIGDEISSKEWRDRSKESEGSKLTLLRARLQQSAAPMLYAGSTPTNVGDCLVSEEYERSDRRVWKMPCPSCEEDIEFLPDVRLVSGRNDRRGPGLRYRRDDRRRVVDAWYECACGRLIEEDERDDMIAFGRFVATNPEGEEGHVGVYAWAIHSDDPGSSWKKICKDHQAAIMNPILLMPGFTNLRLAQPYDAAPTRISDPSSLRNRREVWLRPDGSRAGAPSWTQLIVWAVDCQRGYLDDATRPPRFEATAVAIGRGRRRAVLDHVVISHREVIDMITGEIERIPVEPFTAAASDLLWAQIAREFETADGRKLRGQRTFVDVSWRLDDAVKFCTLPRSVQLGIIGIRGSGVERNGQREEILPPKLRLPRGRETGRRYLTIGTQSAKDKLGKLLKAPAPYADSYVFADHLPDSYFDGLVAEFPDEIRPGAFHWTRISESNTGEPWDCLVYAYAAERYELALSGKKSKLAAIIDTLDPEMEAAALEAEAEAIVGTKVPDKAAEVVEDTEASPDAPPEEPLPEPASRRFVRQVDPPSSRMEIPGTPRTDTPAQTPGGVRFRAVQRTQPEPLADKAKDKAARLERLRGRKVKGIGW